LLAGVTSFVNRDPSPGTPLQSAEITTLTTYPSAAALAAHAGLAPISRESGRRQGHQIRPHRYHRGLRRVFSMSSFAALSHCARSRAYYDKKRAEGKTPLSAFAGFRFPVEVIVVAVAWYLRFGLPYRDVEELLAERGIEVDHVTVYRWLQRFTPLLPMPPGRPSRAGRPVVRG
jgi:hypothetical protein